MEFKNIFRAFDCQFGDRWNIQDLVHGAHTQAIPQHMEIVDRGLDHRVQFERGIPIDLHEFAREMLCDGNTFV